VVFHLCLLKVPNCLETLELLAHALAGMITILSVVISILAFRFRRRAAPRNAPAHPQLLLPRLIVTLDGNIAVVCCRPRSPLDEYFATHCIRNGAVATTNISIAAMSVRWLCRKLRQVDEESLGRHRRYCPTVAWLTSGEAHPTDQVTDFRTILDRPGRHDRRQYIGKPLRCHWTTVAGFTNTMAFRTCGQTR
jgi:hypothetical protein